MPSRIIDGLSTFDGWPNSDNTDKDRPRWGLRAAVPILAALMAISRCTRSATALEIAVERELAARQLFAERETDGIPGC